MQSLFVFTAKIYFEDNNGKDVEQQFCSYLFQIYLFFISFFIWLWFNQIINQQINQ